MTPELTPYIQCMFKCLTPAVTALLQSVLLAVSGSCMSQLSGRYWVLWYVYS